MAADWPSSQGLMRAAAPAVLLASHFPVARVPCLESAALHLFLRTRFLQRNLPAPKHLTLTTLNKECSSETRLVAKMSTNYSVTILHPVGLEWQAARLNECRGFQDSNSLASRLQTRSFLKLRYLGSVCCFLRFLMFALHVSSASNTLFAPFIVILTIGAPVGVPASNTNTLRHALLCTMQYSHFWPHALSPSGLVAHKHVVHALKFPSLAKEGL